MLGFGHFAPLQEVPLGGYEERSNGPRPLRFDLLCRVVYHAGSMRIQKEIAMIIFGEISKYQSDEKLDLGVSDDKRALTVTFSDFHAAAGGANAQAPSATRLFSLVIPLKGDDGSVEVEFIVSSFVKTLTGSTATLLTSVNGQTTVSDFPENSDQSFEQKLKFVAPTPSELRFCLFLLVGRDSRNPDAEAFASVSTVDIEILPRPQ